ncbi:MAG: RHS repeat-associated core domain-containing protein [Crenarchaeota archaeon]|nr:RHS repeat-associated core domain-containing protein [Thermoproteota archaeon]
MEDSTNTGLYYMNARYYNPNTGRFLSQDSYKGSAYAPWTQHLYTYDGNNPVNMVDPTGHFGEGLANWWAGIKEDAVSMWNGIGQNLERRANEAFDTPSFRSISNYLTLGMVERAEARYSAMQADPSFSSIANYATMGFADTFNRAVNPEEPLSLDHLLSSLSVATTIYATYSVANSAITTRANIKAWENGIKIPPIMHSNRLESLEQSLDIQSMALIKL